MSTYALYEYDNESETTCLLYFLSINLFLFAEYKNLNFTHNAVKYLHQVLAYKFKPFEENIS